VTNLEDFPDWSHAYDDEVPVLTGEEFPPLSAPAKVESKGPATYTSAVVVVDPKLSKLTVKAFPGGTGGGSPMDVQGEQKPILPKKQTPPTEVKAAPEPKRQEAKGEAKGSQERPPLPKAPVMKPKLPLPPVPVFLPNVPPPMAPPPTPPPTPRAVEPVKEEDKEVEFEEEPGVADVEMQGASEEEGGDEDSAMRDSEPTERTSEPREMPRAPWRDEARGCYGS
jgi:hypothetical protein